MFLAAAVGDSARAGYATAWTHWRRFVALSSGGDAPLVIGRCVDQLGVEFVLAEFLHYLVMGGGGHCRACIATCIGYVGGVVQGHFFALSKADSKYVPAAQT